MQARNPRTEVRVQSVDLQAAPSGNPEDRVAILVTKAVELNERVSDLTKTLIGVETDGNILPIYPDEPRGMFEAIERRCDAGIAMLDDAANLLAAIRNRLA